MNVVNLPTKRSGVVIECKKDEGKYTLVNSDGWIIFELYTSPDGSIAPYELASLVRQVRDRGFEQGRQHIRDALGI